MSDREYTGDDYLSSNDRMMWGIHQHILLKWNMFTIFKYQMFNCATGTKGHLQWFVPDEHPYTTTVKAWLESELQQFVIEPGGDEWPGQDVEVVVAGVHTYSGLTPYLEREQAEALAHNCMKQFMALLKKQQEDPG
jgi:hypothetical protein